MNTGHRWDLLLRHVQIATMSRTLSERKDGALAVKEGRIVWIGADGDLPADAEAELEIRGDHRWLLPGFIDCHTHLVHAGNRAREHELRMSGASYEEISKAGGGIGATVAATRAASEEELLRESAPRLRALMTEGVTTVEIKSGYGLDLETERRMLRTARRLEQDHPVRVRTTFLGAHAVPGEFADRPDEYIEFLCAKVLPELRAENLVDAVDAFCETIGFSPAQVRRLFAAACALELPVKLHTEQLSNQGGAALAAEFGALSADHLEHLDEAGIRAMTASGTVAVLLPGAFYCLRETRQPPVERLRSLGVPMAVATDCNPGTSPLTSILLAMHMACTLFGLSPSEALAGTTREAATALGLGAEIGTLEVDKRADLVLWEIERPAELCYRLGWIPPHQRIYDGRV